MTDLLAALTALHGRWWLQPEQADRIIKAGGQVIEITKADRRKYAEFLKAAKESAK